MLSEIAACGLALTSCALRPAGLRRRSRAPNGCSSPLAPPASPKMVDPYVAEPDWEAGAVAEGRSAAAVKWSTFYDIRRYGGLQILAARPGRRRGRWRLSAGGRAGRRFSDPAWRFRRYPSFGHAFALAPRIDEPDDRENLAGLYPALRRDRRSGDPQPSAAPRFRPPKLPMPLHRPRPASPSTSPMTAWPDFQPPGPNRPGTMQVRDAGDRRIVADTFRRGWQTAMPAIQNAPPRR